MIHASRLRRTSTLRRKAFTLLEILIVIVIIAQLAAILFPVFSKVRENARRSSCQSNMRQIGLGMMQYAQDYDDVLPLVAANSSSGHLNVFNTYNGNTTNRVFDMAKSSIAPYVMNSQVFICPSDVKGEPRKMSYALISCITNSVIDANDTLYGRSLAYFQDTTKWIALGEEQHTTYGTTDDGLIDMTRIHVTNLPSVVHTDGANNLFLDGHVKWLRRETAHAAGYYVGGAYATSPTSVNACPS